MSEHGTLHQQLMRLRNAPVIRSREKRDVLPAGQPGVNTGLTRPFFCRACAKETLADRIPEGWYTINRHTTDKSVRLGVYCSIECLISQLPRLRGIDHDLADRGVRLRGTHP